METLFKKPEDVFTAKISGFNFITTREDKRTLACLTFHNAGKVVNAIIGEKAVFPITDLLSLCNRTITAVYTGESDPDSANRTYPKIRISEIIA